MTEEVNGFESALKYLTYMGRTEKEIYSYLLKKGCSENEIPQVIKKLREYNFIDDVQYAASFTCSNKNKKKSRREIEHKMKSKGIADEVIQNILSNEYTQEEEIENALSVMKKYYARYKARETERLEYKVKQAVFQKGFSYDIVNEAYKILLLREDDK